MQLRSLLLEKAKKSSKLTGISFLKGDPIIKYAPLQLAQFKDNDSIYDTNDAQNIAFETGHQHTRNEILNQTQNTAMGNIFPKEFFKKSRNFVSYSSDYNDIVVEKGIFSEEAKTFLDELGNIVGIIGQAGVGKTTLTKVLLKRITGKERLYNVDYIFFVTLRDFSDQRKMNFLEFLIGKEIYKSSKWMQERNRRNAVLKKLSESASVCILLDGLDETDIQLNKETTFNINIYEEQLPQQFILSLLNGKCFSKAKKIVTSRPRQMIDLPPSIRPKFLINILGIDKKGQRQICKNICGGSTDQIFNNIQNEPDLSAFCYTPINCILVCHCLYRYSIAGKKQNRRYPTNITDVLVSTIVLFFDTEHARKTLNLKNLSKLAWNGIKEKKLYFDDDDLKRAGLARTDDNTFIVTLRGEDESYPLVALRKVQKNYSYFSHRILQEFLGAIHLTFFDDREEEKLLFATGLLNLKSNHLELVSKFLYGLCNECIVQKIEQIKSHHFCRPKHTDLLKNFARTTMKTSCKEILDRQERFQTYLQVSSWVYEMQDQQLIEEISCMLPDSLEIRGDFLPSDAIPFCHMIKARKSSLEINIFSTVFAGDAMLQFLNKIEPILTKLPYIAVSLSLF